MIDLHYWTSPNGHKITMFLEGTRLPYCLVPIETTKNAQFEDEFLKISVERWLEAVASRPATQRAYSIAKQLNPQAPMPVRRAERLASRRTG